LKIIHLILGKANPERMNGVNRVVSELADAQHKAGQQVAIWGFTRDLRHNYPERSVATHLFKQKRNLFLLDPSFARALENLDSKEVVFHLHGGYIPSWYTVSRVLHERDFRFVFTPHGSYNVLARKRSQFWKWLYFQFFEKHLLQRAGYIHCLGSSEVSGLESLYPTQKCRLIPYGFEPSNSVIETPPPAEDFVIGYCGRMDVFTKGLDLALEGFSQFLKKHPGAARFWLIGDGQERNQLERKAQKLGIRGQVHFLGRVFGKDKERLLRQMHVFLHPSRNEGLPSAVLEACSLGLPCIVSKETNLASYINQHKAGIGLEHNTAQAIVEALQKTYDLYREEGLAQWQANAIQLIRIDFSWKQLTQRLHQLYENTLFTPSFSEKHPMDAFTHSLH
jgi:glycosyltransferase involved in cell wall biosynthesis